MRTTLIAVGLVALTSALLSAQQPSQPFPRLALSDWLRSVTDGTNLRGLVPPLPECNFLMYAGDKNEGRIAAKKKHNYSWYAVGAGTGLLLPLVGPVILAVVAYHGKPQPDSIPKGLDDTCYRQGFRVQARSERGVAAFVGGLAGMAAGFIAVQGFHANDAIVFPLVPGKIGNNK